MRSHAPPTSRLRPTTAIWRTAALVLGAVVVAGCALNAPRPGDDPAASRAAWFRAVQDARTAAAADSTEADGPFRLARLYVEVDSTSRARTELERALARDADHNPSLSLVSKLDFDGGRHEEAISRLEAARDRQGSLPEPMRLGLALHYEALADFEASEREFAAATGASTPAVYHQLRSEDFLEAGDVAARALVEAPYSAAAHNNFGITRLYAGDPDTAKEHFLQSLELDPEHGGALYNLAIVEAFYFFDDDRGREWFNRYLATGSKDDPDDLHTHFGTGSEASASEVSSR
jgi:tetratricopeptide (TPR) repeat protein